MISLGKTDECLSRLGMLRHFPAKPAVIAEVGRLLNDLCGDDQAADRLTADLLRSNSEWPGPAAVREAAGRLVSGKAQRPQECPACGDMQGWRRVANVYDLDNRTDKIVRGSAGGHITQGEIAALRDQYPSPRWTVYDTAIEPCPHCEGGRRNA